MSEVLTPAEVAAELRCSARYVTNLCATGRLRAFRIGTLWRITREALEQFERGEQVAS